MTVGRLILPVIRWHPTSGFEAARSAIDDALAFGAGGFILFGGPADEVARLTEKLRRDAGRPLLIGADLERGAGQQFEGLRELPPPAALASLGDLGAIRDAGAMTGADARAVGVNWVYAPVADLDLEPTNPIVQTRSFGSDPGLVSAAVTAWIEGAQMAGVMTCAKHFPGHGRTTRDSHDHLPQVDTTKAELARTDLRPFDAAIAARVDAIMTCHVSFPALDPSGRPATLSKPILDFLRKERGFDGLVVSDALIMEGAKAGGSITDAAVAAVRAGVDLLLYPPDPVATYQALQTASDRDPILAATVASALDRYQRALTAVDLSTDRTALLRAPGVIADRIVAQSGAVASLRAPLDLVVIDDDLDGAYPASSSDWVRATLEAAEVPLGAGGSRIALVFAEPRASKGRAGLGDRSTGLLQAGRWDLVMLFGHPRLEQQLPRSVPVVRVWHRQRLMQEAAARWLMARHETRPTGAGSSRTR